MAKPSLQGLGLSNDAVWDLPTYLIIGILLGGRIGYVVFYDAAYYLAHPLHVISVWEGGMAYHGGALGAVAASWLFARRHRIPILPLLDVMGWVSTIGIGLGRVANFINGELVGRVADVPWAMIFPNNGDVARHPSQLYEALGEGVVLFALLSLIRRSKRLIPGQLFGTYLVGYGVIRFGLEYFREPDIQKGFVLAQLSMGQVLCSLMVVGGVGIISWSFLRRLKETR